ncbi:transglutaminase domain-containing protein [bacterium]|nr:transglutaminase domain-containing protein [bacterium]
MASRPARVVPLLAALLLAASLPAPVAGAQQPTTVRVVWSNAADFAACFRDGNIDVTTEPGAVRLAPTLAIAHGTGNHAAKLTIASNQVARKIFRLAKPAPNNAELFVSGRVAKADFNGSEIACRYLDGVGWSAAPVPGPLLRHGENIVEFGPGTVLAFDTDEAPPRFSQLADSTGQTAQPAPGEFLVHLRLRQHSPQGTITSEVIDLANPRGEDRICPLLKVRSVRFFGPVSGSTPGATRLRFEIEGRTGPTSRPDGRWTEWSAGRLRGNRFAQWRASLTMAPPKQWGRQQRADSPVLKGVSMVAKVVSVATAEGHGLTLKELRNQRIIRSSYPFTHQTPSPKLARLRSEWKLDDVIAGGKTEFEQLVLLRNWVRNQWPHNEGSCRRPWDAIDILSAPAGDHGMCVHYGVTYAQCALALGFNARQVLLKNHYVADVWSNDHGKWVLMDVEAVQPEGWERYGTALYWNRERDEPMSIVDLHREAWVRNRPDNIIQKLAMTETDGTFRVHDRVYEQDQYRNFHHTAQFTRNNYLDQLEPWERQHGVDYYRSDEYLWWQDTAEPIVAHFTRHTNRDGDFLWTVNQAAITLTATDTADRLTVLLDTVTPNLQGYRYRINGGEWQRAPGDGTDPHSRRASLTWELRAGDNTLEVKPRNLFDRDGIVSRVTVVR